MIDNFIELGNLFELGDVDKTISQPVFHSIQADSLSQLLIALNIPSDKSCILFNTNVSDTSPGIDRSWPVASFIDMANYCIQKGYAAIFIGGKGQEENTNAIAKQCAGAHSLAGHLSLEELLALMKQSLLLITNDSGPLHCAVSVGLPTFSFFGTESPTMFGYDTPIHRAFCAYLACSPCLSVFNYKRGSCEFNSACMKSIPVEEVIHTFNEKESLLKVHLASRLTSNSKGNIQ
jgi:ADP-heptose:LPS heptosyltransferase